MWLLANQRSEAMSMLSQQIPVFQLLQVLYHAACVCSIALTNAFCVLWAAALPLCLHWEKNLSRLLLDLGALHQHVWQSQWTQCLKFNFVKSGWIFWTLITRQDSIRWGNNLLSASFAMLVAFWRFSANNGSQYSERKSLGLRVRFFCICDISPVCSSSEDLYSRWLCAEYIDVYTEFWAYYLEEVLPTASVVMTLLVPECVGTGDCW